MGLLQDDQILSNGCLAKISGTEAPRNSLESEEELDNSPLPCTATPKQKEDTLHFPVSNYLIFLEKTSILL